jgi:hypothetical protein
MYLFLFLEIRLEDSAGLKSGHTDRLCWPTQNRRSKLRDLLLIRCYTKACDSLPVPGPWCGAKANTYAAFAVDNRMLNA